MRKVFLVTAAALSLFLAACGGGGGSAGSPGTGGGSSGGATQTATATLQLVDGAGAAVSGSSLSQTEVRQLKVTLKNARSQVVPYKRVTVELDSPLAVLTPASGSLLTDANGVALFTIAPASVSSNGAVTATATASVEGAEATGELDMQISPGSVALSAITTSSSTVQKGQSLNVSVAVTVNGAPASSNSLAVSFTSTCGTASPGSALVDGSGTAQAVVQTTSTGNCSVTASAVNAQSRTAAFVVSAPPVVGLQFVSASPTVIYQQGSLTPNSSIVTFRVIDAQDQPVQGQTVNASLIGGGGGVSFCNAAQTDVSSATGQVTFAVCSGTQPTTVQVRAQLAGTSLETYSNLLTVQTGLPTQRFFDISASQQNFYVGGYFTDKFNGKTVDISVFAADRQGNPVPNGTPVVLVSEGGQLNTTGNSSCVLTDGRCTVQLIGQDYRPLGSSVSGSEKRPGRVTVLATADGEESFIDANNNNRYDAGELVEQLGTPFMDKNESLQFDAAYTNLIVNSNESEVTYPIPASAIGTAACPANTNIGLSQGNSCNSQWDGFTKVRRSLLVVFSGGEIGLPNTQSDTAATCTHSVNAASYDATIDAQYRTKLLSCSLTRLQVRLADRNGNPLPADATLAVVVRKPQGNQCTATLSGSAIGNATEPTEHTVLLDKCLGGGVENVDLTVTVSAGSGSKSSTFSVTLP